MDDRLASQQNQINSLLAQCSELSRQLRQRDDHIDTFVCTPAWKRLVFWLDGWSAHQLVDRPRWRPWRRWWTS